MSHHPDFDVLTRTCPSRTSLARIANKWTAMVVTALGDEKLRFTELRTAVTGISNKVLTVTLRDLERDGLVARHVHEEKPPRVEYELTELGHTLLAPLAALWRWADEHTGKVLAARESYDARR
ncbi:winged helix-turn-helix transcriptional regulator [Amycolatopsis vastitatis]|uniref:Transcriptional regulator n=1 Tax=Amycolatopsis vastitatis TaxID=1905142 RepID=A0A229SMG0_9PSEU|nr:helix-turn-helix domain-containing protein [Amycolatopsis vastitatis]OXM60000.1 transcriptional regulator [Amycolatopsis vastitatis]